MRIVGKRGRRRRRKRSNAIDTRLERETMVSVARDLARTREMEAIVAEQARLKAEAIARRNRP